MQLFIDGDALPNLLKPIIYRTIQRLALPTIVIANKRINIGESDNITYLVVAAGPDEADNRIVEMVEAEDLVITADIPLADRVITKKAHAINHHGKLFSQTNIKNSLAMRNLMQELRDSGEVTRGPAPLNQKDAQKFANQFNNFLAKQKLDRKT